MDHADLGLVFEIFTWIVVAVLAVAYWLQVFKIHKHKEVRDLSLVSYSVLAVGYFFLLIEAIIDSDMLSIYKSASILIPCMVILMLINHNKHCEWVDDDDVFKCRHCGKILQPHHLYCSSCGISTTNKEKISS